MVTDKLVKSDQRENVKKIYMYLHFRAVSGVPQIASSDVKSENNSLLIGMAKSWT